MMTVHGQEAPPKKTHFRYNKVDVWMELQCFSYLHGPFSAALGPRARAPSPTLLLQGVATLPAFVEGAS